jgi:hypothetical protein
MVVSPNLENVDRIIRATSDRLNEDRKNHTPPQPDVTNSAHGIVCGCRFGYDEAPATRIRRFISSVARAIF